ncbi:Pyridoxal phosphate-dependent decarboxylase [Macrophomina phaseolina MS6]|uniref:Pyridoxal phosphate-dependent decarboxylase n=1 Tax=Macrophomina phaseolina (strain MS6) TaxID=1126212 RepID=K2R465_MACPH|nr:Pyridoxal phosphate-dependent decarboxylase [Macrophomina phaseolina MS6]
MHTKQRPMHSICTISVQTVYAPRKSSTMVRCRLPSESCLHPWANTLSSIPSTAPRRRLNRICSLPTNTRHFRNTITDFTQFIDLRLALYSLLCHNNTNTSFLPLPAPALTPTGPNVKRTARLLFASLCWRVSLDSSPHHPRSGRFYSHIYSWDPPEGLPKS